LTAIARRLSPHCRYSPAWWTRWPRANIGLRTGLKADLFALDVDPRNGGEATFLELVAHIGDLPRTLQVHTGGGGAHRFFRHPGWKVKSVKGKLGPGVDVKEADQNNLINFSEVATGSSIRRGTHAGAVSSDSSQPW